MPTLWGLFTGNMWPEYVVGIYAYQNIPSNTNIIDKLVVFFILQGNYLILYIITI